jgi:heptosyltransferase II
VSLILLRLLASLLLRLPLPVLQGITIGAGEIIFVLARRRRRELLSNLSHAFPDRDYPWLVATGRESIHQMVEFGLLAVVLPCCDEARLRRIFRISDSSRDFLLQKTASARPVVLLAPHLGPQEGLCLLPLLAPEIAPIGGLYRPVKNEAIDTWVRQSRERFGVRLFSRKQGLQGAIRLLRENHWFGLLFDQNSSGQGARITFFDRVASATDLPGIVAEKYQADIVFLYAQRHAFWQIELVAAPGPNLRDKDEITFATNHWLQELLRHNEALLPGWLWAHNRWRHQRIPQFSLRPKKNLLAKQNAFLQRQVQPRTERFFIRLPDQSTAVELFLPLLRTLRASRTDAAITVVGHPALLSLVAGAGLCEQALALPPAGLGRYRFFWSLRHQFPRLYLILTDSRRHDFEAWLTRAPHRYGMARADRKARPLLTQVWTDPEASSDHPPERWQRFLHAYGMGEE